MPFKQLNILPFLLIMILFSDVKLQSQPVTFVYPNDDKITDYCSKNVYYFEFKCKFSEKITKIIPFQMEIPLPYRLLFKCVIDGPNSKILCFHSFSNYVWSLSDNSRIELPYSFPNIEGIRWDYDSFLTKIYRYLWRTKGNCGLELQPLNNDQSINSQIEKDLNQDKEKKSEIVANINKIYNGKCQSSKYDFTFNMLLKLNDGEIVEELKNAKNNKNKMKISLLHNINVPLLLGEKKKKGTTTFSKNFEYKYAVCNYEGEINQDNFDNSEGLSFECHIKVNRYMKFKGPLQIKPFTDFVYVTKTDKDGKDTTKIAEIQFEIPSSSKIEDDDDEEGEKNTKTRLEEKTQIESNLNVRKMQQNSNIKEPNFLILDSNLNIFICPDKPILVVKNYNEGIGFGGLNTSGSKYLFLIYGYLTNGYDFVNDTMTLLELTKEEIKFYLKITDNLETPDNRKKSVKCTIPSGTSINKNTLIEVKCIGSRAQLNNNNTDLILNWNLEENNNLDNILVKWPYDLTKKKHIFFYNVQGLSVKKENYGCFENKFYFYLYVYDLKAEPKISFNLPLIYPKNSYAECKLYNSVTFKCSIDLRLKKISKGGKIILSNNVREYLLNNEQNIVLYTVSNNTFASNLDFMVPIEEDCGDFILVGALKDIGYTYLQVIFIIIGCLVGLLLCIFGIAFCVIYEITHRNRKGKYFKYTEEKEIPNTSTTQNQPPV